MYLLTELNHELILKGSLSLESPVNIAGAGHLGRLLPSGGADIPGAGDGLGLGLGLGLGGLLGVGLGLGLGSGELWLLGGAGSEAAGLGSLLTDSSSC